MKVIRLIEGYDNLTEKLVEEYSITSLDFNELKEFITPLADDEYYYYPYEINNELKEYLETKGFKLDSKNISYFLASYIG